MSAFNSSAVIPSLPLAFPFFIILSAFLISSCVMLVVVISSIVSLHSSSFISMGFVGSGLFSVSSKCSFHLSNFEVVIG